MIPNALAFAPCFERRNDSKRPKERRFQTAEGQSHQPGLRVVPYRAVERRLLHPNRLRSLLQRPWPERPQLRSELSLADSGCCLRQLLDPDSSAFASLFTWRVADDAKQRPHPATHGILTRLKAGETIPDASWRQDTVC